MILNVQSSFSQSNTLIVNYQSTFKTEDGQYFNFFYKLIDNGNESIFLNSDSIVGDKRFVLKTSKKDKGLFFDKVRDKMYLYSPILNKDFYIIEKNISNEFKWTIHQENKKKILGYDCHTAKTHFRGRNYTAFYTEDLSFSAGPFKFIGLPGVILEIFDNDKLFQFQATKITLKNDKTILSNPYHNIKEKEFISFWEHKDILLKKLDDYQSKLQADEKEIDTEHFVKDQSIEIYEKK